MKYLIVIFILFLSWGCNSQEEIMQETPLISIIKLNSAESVKNFEEAEKYIEVKEAYKNDSTNDPYKEWKETVNFFYSRGNSKKFTNQFLYHKYHIIEKTDNLKATVNLIAKNENAKVRKIIYSLRLINDRWKVITIKYINQLSEEQ